MARATERTAPVAESPHARSTLKSSSPAGPTSGRVSTVPSSGPLVRAPVQPRGLRCALLMAPVMAAAMGLAALSLGMAALAVGGLAIAVALTVREVRRARGGASVRPGFAVAAGALYLASVPYLMFFIWLWFVD